MKILSLHCDYIKFKPLRKALKRAEPLSEQEKKENIVKEALVILTAVEKSDSNIDLVVKKLVEDIKDIAKKVNTKNLVIYPYAHLSSNLAPPDIAVQVLKNAEKELKKTKYLNVVRAPFGYYKEFELKCKGHPLSELSKEIKVEKGKGIAWEEYEPRQLLREISRAKLDTSKLKDNDHRIIGQQMDLYSFSDVAPGMVFWHNNGLIIKNELINFWREIHKKSGYQEISTPQVMDKKLWQISGHWEKYRENIFLTEYERRQFAVKPMNCPGGMLIYKANSKSYKELPLRIGELGIVHRQELSGVLGGLFRATQFTQDDAHIFCTEKQLEGELIAVINLVDFVYKKFNLPYRVELSTKPEKRIGGDKVWSKSEKILEKVLKKKKISFRINKGEGAFYGPKIDFHIKDSLNREWQCATLQLDFSMPERFELEYTDKDNKRKRPVMLHRVIYGALERFIGILIEHTNGRLPTWLAPIQVRVLSFTDRNIDYAKKIIKKIGEAIPDLRIDADLRPTTVSSKVKDAELMRVPYIITMGDKEKQGKTLAIREKGKKEIKSVKINDFIETINEEIKERK